MGNNIGKVGGELNLSESTSKFIEEHKEQFRQFYNENKQTIIATLQTLFPYIKDMVEQYADMALNMVDMNDPSKLSGLSPNVKQVIAAVVDLVATSAKIAMEMAEPYVEGMGKYGSAEFEINIKTDIVEKLPQSTIDFIKENADKMKEVLKEKTQTLIDIVKKVAADIDISVIGEAVNKILDVIDWVQYSGNTAASTIVLAMPIGPAGTMISMGINLLTIMTSTAISGAKLGVSSVTGKYEGGAEGMDGHYSGAYEKLAAQYVQEDMYVDGEMVGGEDTELKKPDDLAKFSNMINYLGTVNSETKRRLVDDLITILESFGFKVEGGATTLDKLYRIIEKVPTGDKFRKDDETQKKICNKIAAGINKVLGEGTIDMTKSTEHICANVADLLVSLTSAIHVEFLHTYRNASIVLSNLEVLANSISTIYGNLFQTLANKDISSKVATLHKMAMDEISRQIQLLKNLTHIELPEVDKQLMSMIQSNKLITDLKNGMSVDLGTADFNKVLSHLLKSIGTSAVIIQFIEKALADTGMTLSDYVKTANLDELADKLSEMSLNIPMKDKDVQTYLASVKLLVDNFSKREDIAKAKEGGNEGLLDSSLASSGNDDSYQAMSIDKRVDNRRKLRNIIFTAFHRQLMTHFDVIIATLENLASKLGSEIPLSDQLDGLRSALSKLGIDILNNKNIYWALIGYHNDALSKSKRDTMLGELRMIQSYLETLSEMPMYSGVSYFKDVYTAVTGLIETIDKFSDEVAAKFGGGVREGGNDDDDGDDDGVDEERAGGAEPMMFKGPAEITRSPKRIADALRKFDYYYRAAQIKANLKRSSAEIDHYGKRYNDLLGKSVANKINEQLKKLQDEKRALAERKSHYEKMHPNDPSKSKKEYEAALEFMQNQFAARKKFWNTLEAIDMYMRMFTNNIVKSHHDLRDIKSMLDSIEIVSDWYNESTGNKLVSVFEHFPAYVRGTGDASNNNERYMPNDAYRSNDGDNVEHYYSRISERFSDADNEQSYPGNPYLITDPTEGAKAREMLHNTLVGLGNLKNLISVFVNIGNKFGDKEIHKELPMTPAMIYNNLVEFLQYSAFSQGFKETGNRADSIMDVRRKLAIDRDLPSKIVRAINHMHGANHAERAQILEVVNHLLDTRSDFENWVPELITALGNQGAVIPAGHYVTAVAASGLTDIPSANITRVHNLEGNAGEANRTTLANTIKGLIANSFGQSLSDTFTIGRQHEKLPTLHLDINSNTIHQDGSGADHGTYQVDANNALTYVNLGVAPGANTTTLTNFRTRYGIVMRGIPSAHAGDYDLAGSDDMQEEDQFFVIAMKAMAAKIFTTIGMFDLLDRPEAVAPMRPIRMIVGGDDTVPAINPDIVELYFRLPLLAQFYRNLFNGDDYEDDRDTYTKIGRKDKVMKISMVPEMEGTFSSLIRLVFQRFGYQGENAVYSDSDLAEIVREVNLIYTRMQQKHPENTIIETLHEFVAEVNRRYGIVTRDEYQSYVDAFGSYRYDYYSSDHDRYAQDNPVDYAILPGEDEFMPTVKNVPSDRWVNKDSLTSASGSGNMFGVTLDHRKLLYRFRCMIDKWFSNEEYGREETTFKPAIKSLQMRLKTMQSENATNEDRLRALGTLIRGSDSYSRIDSIKYVMFHETVVSGLNALSTIHTMLHRFMVSALSIDLDYIQEGIKNVLTSHTNAAGDLHFGGDDDNSLYKLVCKYIHDKYPYLEINTTDNITQGGHFDRVFGRFEAMQANGGHHNGFYYIKRINGVNADLSRSGEIAVANGRYAINNNTMGAILSLLHGLAPEDLKNNDNKDRLETIYRFSIDHEYVMKTLLELLFGLHNDMQGLVSVRFENGKIFINYGKLRSLINDLFTSVRYFVDVFRPHINKEVFNRYVDKLKPGSLYWLEEQLLEKIINGRPGRETKNAEDRRQKYINIDGIAERLTKTFSILTKEWAIDGAGLATGADANTASQVNVATDNTKVNKYDKVFASMIFYDASKLNSGLVNSIDAPGVTQGGTIAVRTTTDGPQLVDFMGLHDPIEHLYFNGATSKDKTIDLRYIARYKQLYTWGKEFTPNTSMMFMFNQILANYMSQVYDPAVQKIYAPAVMGLANGPMSQSIMNQEYTWPDTWPGLLATLSDIDLKHEKVQETVDRIIADVASTNTNAHINMLVNDPNVRANIIEKLTRFLTSNRAKVNSTKTLADYHVLLNMMYNHSMRRIMVYANTIQWETYANGLAAGAAANVTAIAPTRATVYLLIGVFNMMHGNNVQLSESRKQYLLKLCVDAIISYVFRQGATGADLANNNNFDHTLFTNVKRLIYSAIDHDMKGFIRYLRKQVLSSAELEHLEVITRVPYVNSKSVAGIDNNDDVNYRVGAMFINTTAQYNTMMAANNTVVGVAGALRVQDYIASLRVQNVANDTAQLQRMSQNFINMLVDQNRSVANRRSLIRTLYRQIVTNPTLSAGANAAAGLGAPLADMLQNYNFDDALRGRNIAIGRLVRVSLDVLNEDADMSKLDGFLVSIQDNNGTWVNPAQNPFSNTAGTAAHPIVALADELNLSGLDATGNAAVAVARYRNAFFPTQTAAQINTLMVANTHDIIHHRDFVANTNIATISAYITQHRNAPPDHISLHDKLSQDAMLLAITHTLSTDNIEKFRSPFLHFHKFSNIINPNTIPILSALVLARATSNLNNIAFVEHINVSSNTLMSPAKTDLKYIASLHDIQSITNDGLNINEDVTRLDTTAKITNIRLAQHDNDPHITSDVEPSSFSLYGIKTPTDNYNWGQRTDRVNFGHRLDPIPDRLLFTSLSVIIRNIITTKAHDSKPYYLVDTINDVPGYMKERYRAYMPIYKNMLASLIARGELLKSFMQYDKLDMTRDFSMSPLNAPLPPNDPTNNPWPGKALKSIERDSDENKKYFTRLIEGITNAATSLSHSIDSVLRDLVDDPKYFELYQGSITDYQAQHNTQPFMPTSSMLSIVKSTDSNARENLGYPVHNVGSSAFKFLYGNRFTLAAPKQTPQDEHIPGFNNLVADYNSNIHAKMQIPKDKAQKFVKTYVSALRYINELSWYKGLVVDSWSCVANPNEYSASDDANAAVTHRADMYHKRTWYREPVANDNDMNITNKMARSIVLHDGSYDRNRGYPKPAFAFKHNIHDIIALTESTQKEESIKKLVKWIAQVSQQPTRLDVQNVIDMNIMPINIHALMREIPFANLYNYAYTYDRMIIDLYYGMDSANAHRLIAELCGHEHKKLGAYEGGDDFEDRLKKSPLKKVTSSRDTLVSLLINPYLNVTEEGTSFTNMSQLYDVFLRRLMLGDSSVELGRPKFLSDQLYNKLLFGELYTDPSAYNEAGPHHEDANPPVFDNRLINGYNKFVVDVSNHIMGQAYSVIASNVVDNAVKNRIRAAIEAGVARIAANNDDVPTLAAHINSQVPQLNGANNNAHLAEVIIRLIAMVVSLVYHSGRQAYRRITRGVNPHTAIKDIYTIVNTYFRGITRDDDQGIDNANLNTEVDALVARVPPRLKALANRVYRSTVGQVDLTEGIGYDVVRHAINTANATDAYNAVNANAASLPSGAPAAVAVDLVTAQTTGNVTLALLGEDYAAPAPAGVDYTDAFHAVKRNRPAGAVDNDENIMLYISVPPTSAIAPVDNFPVAISGDLHYMKSQHDLIDNDGDAVYDDRDPDDLRVYDDRQIIKAAIPDGHKHILYTIGKLRFNTILVRNLMFISNLYRSVTLKLNKELMYSRDIIQRSYAITNPAITEFRNNQVYRKRENYDSSFARRFQM